jgi:MFS transporter, PAT family, beta-lactamase induction signal transducer AmpG
MFSKISSKLHSYTKSGLLTILFMGFASGFPFALTASVMSLRLKESGISISSIGLFTLVAVPYSFKYLWAPLLDGLKLPLLQKLFGRRRGWLCLVQILLMAALFLFGMLDPQRNIYLFAILALCITFLSATQDIIIDAYRIERLAINLQGVGAAFTSYGWRAGSFISGVLPLIIAETISWSVAYYVAASIMIVGILTTLLSEEPLVEKTIKKLSPKGLMPFLSNTFVSPFKDLLKIQGIYYILLFVILFKLGDAMAGVMTMPFLIDKGFNKLEIVAIVKTFGLAATFGGLFLGGLLAYKVSLKYSLLIAGIVQMLSNLLFVYQDYIGHDKVALIITIAGENLSSGIGITIFIAYLSSVCNVRFAATHYALLSSVATLSRNLISSSSGFIVENSNWSVFFLISTAAAIPALLLIPKLTFFKQHRTTKTT